MRAGSRARVYPCGDDALAVARVHSVSEVEAAVSEEESGNSDAANDSMFVVKSQRTGREHRFSAASASEAEAVRAA